MTILRNLEKSVILKNLRTPILVLYFILQGKGKSAFTFVTQWKIKDKFPKYILKLSCFIISSESNIGFVKGIKKNRHVLKPSLYVVHQFILYIVSF
jgi:hypothetical protein